MRQRLFYSLGGGLACDFTGALAAHAVEYGKQPALRDRQEAILIDRAFRVEPPVTHKTCF